MKTPYEQAKAVYDNEPCLRTFEQDLELHFLHGFVFSRPDFFIMGRPVISNASQAQIVDCAVIFPSEHCDCWCVHVMSGNMAKAFSIMPWELPLICFERKNVLRFHALSTIERLSGAANQLNTA